MRKFTFIFFILLSISNYAQWTKVSTQNVGLSGRMHAYNSTLFLYGVFSGFHLYKSTDEGANWTDISNKFPYDVYYMHNYNNEIFALTATSGKSIYVSSDGGENWTLRSSIPTVTGNGAIIWMTSDGDKLYAVSNRKSFYTSTDNGKTWTETIINTTAGGNMTCFATASNTMVSTINGTGAVVSTDGGQNWTINNPTNPALQVTYVINFNGSVYGITSGSGVHKFNVATNSWESVSAGLPDALSFQISKAFVKNGNSLYVSTIGFLDSKISIYSSIDNGVNWASVSTTGLDNLNAATSSTSVAFTTQNMFIYDSKNNIATVYKMSVAPNSVDNHLYEAPSQFELSQNYPNPFNANTSIRFHLTKSNHVTLKVYDVFGKEMAILIDEEMAEGIYNVSCNLDYLTSGMYLYKLNVGVYSATKRMILAK